MDITMCANKTCPDAERCLRKQGKPSGWQSYGYFTLDENGHCEGFIEMEGKDEANKV